MPSLKSFFASPQAIPLRGRPISFRAVRRQAVDDVGADVAVDVRALLRLVNEADRAEAIADADRAVNSRLKPGEQAPDGAREEERVFHILFRALRDVDPPHGALCATVEELRGALTLPAANDLWAEYNRFMQEEFPPYVDADEFRRLVEEARKRPLADLGKSFDSVTVRRSLLALGALLLPSETTS